MGMIMKALILAAGIGSRLAPITDNVPKSLVAINGQPILMQQIDSLRQSGVTDITIISGYKYSIMENAVHTKYSEINFINNTDYAYTNNMYSAYLAKDIFSGTDFIMMNADVFFDPSVIVSLLLFPVKSAIVTDIGTYTEESMKVMEQNGRLTRISKDIPQEKAFGVSIDVYKFSSESSSAFFAKCIEYIEHNRKMKLWSEVAIDDILKYVTFEACPLNGRWFEIDNLYDLAAAEKLFL
jgi:choline kinase